MGIYRDRLRVQWGNFKDEDPPAYAFDGGECVRCPAKLGRDHGSQFCRPCQKKLPEATQATILSILGLPKERRKLRNAVFARDLHGPAETYTVSYLQFKD